MILNINIQLQSMKSEQQREDYSQTITQESDQLNKGRIQNSEQLSFILQSSQKNKLTQTSKKSIGCSCTNSYNFRQSIDQLLDATLSQDRFQTPDRSTNMKNATQTIHIFDKTKTANIKAKNKSGKLYKEICPICLIQFDEVKGKLGCNHQFCYQCIAQWSKTSTACPCCRIPYKCILKKKYIKPNLQDQELIEKVFVQAKKMQFNEDDYYICYFCERGDNQHVLLICDICDFYCCHIYCDPLLHNEIPDGQWVCRYCTQRIRVNQNNLNDAENLSMSTISLNQTEEDRNDSQEEQQEFQKPIAARTRSTFNSSMRALRRLRRRI